MCVALRCPCVFTDPKMNPLWQRVSSVELLSLPTRSDQGCAAWCKFSPFDVDDFTVGLARAPPFASEYKHSRGHLLNLHNMPLPNPHPLSLSPSCSVSHSSLRKDDRFPNTHTHTHITMVTSRHAVGKCVTQTLPPMKFTLFDYSTLWCSSQTKLYTWNF